MLGRTEQEIGKLGAGARHAAEAGEVGMHAAEMPRRLVLLGIADGAERAVRLDRHRRAAPGRRTRAPTRRTPASRGCRGRAPSAAVSSASRAPSRLIRQLASLCWTAWNWPMNWPNCFLHLGVLDGEVECALRSAERPAGAGEPYHQRDIGERFARYGRRAIAGVLSNVSSRTAGTARPGVALHRHAGRVACDDCDALASVNTRKCVAVCAPSTNASLPDSASPRNSDAGPRPDRRRTRRAPARPRPCLDARSSSSAPAAFDGCVGKREIGRHRAKQRRRARGASELLEHEHDFAQARFGHVGPERTQTLIREPSPHGGDGLRFTGAFNCAFRRPARSEEFADRPAQQIAIGVRQRFHGTGIRRSHL